jgi:hypothetical protein
VSSKSLEQQYLPRNCAASVPTLLFETDPVHTRASTPASVGISPPSENAMSRHVGSVYDALK